VLCLAAIAGLLLCASAASSAADPPDFGTHCFKEVRPCGDPVVLYETTLFDGPLEVIGFSSKYGPCFSFHHERESSGSTGCGPAPTLSERQPIEMRSWSVLGRKDARLTDVNGYADASVASAQIQFERHHETKTRGLTVIQVAGKLQRQLRLDEPVSLFFGTMRGCVAAKSMRFTAFDAAGEQIGRPQGTVPFGCGRLNHGGGGGIIIGGREHSFQRLSPG